MTATKLATRPQTSRRLMSLVIRLLLAAGLIGLISLKFDMRLATEQILHAGLAACLFGVAGYLGQTLILAWRWHRILIASGIRVRFRATLRIVYSGIFFNQCLPTSLGGDAVRVIMLRAAGSSVKAAANAVLVDRLSGVAALMLFLLVSLVQIAIWAPGSPFLIGAALVTALLGAGLAAYFLGDWIIALVRPLARIGIVRVVAEASAYARFITWRAPSAPVTGLIAIGVHLSTVGIVYGLAAFLNAPISVWQALILVPPIMAAALMPISFGGWGTREVAMVGGLGLAGVPPPTAVAISVLFGLLVLFAALPGGLVWLVSRGPARMSWM